MRVELLDRSYLVGIVKPDVGQSKVAIAGLETNRRASVEAADTRNLPSFAIPVRSQEAIERNIPVVAGHEVVPHVERRLTIVAARGARVIDGRVGIQRLGVGI